ncbi:DUF3284 domain-containing protein [Lactiplantibacillus pingfangensis]|uniref:DUF3284 domain-containing protein n=1 Tax=Lactiplantibacillus pingfangensis TaxID=2559915 RepID=UPI0010F9CEC8|nr:DUF3284 domain-containing protein [Lactiplantibacillus pingfangensis]
MRTDTLSYKYPYQANRAAIYRVLVQEQLAYFQRTDPSIKSLSPGTKIIAQLKTKMSKQPVQDYMMVKDMVPNELFQLETQQPAGSIIQTFKFMKNRRGQAVLAYSEQNVFDNNRSQTNFMMFGLLYKFFYNRGVRKRMAYLDNLAQTATD